MTPEQLQRLERLEMLLAQFTKSDRYTIERLTQLLDGRNIQVGSATGTKIGTASTQKLGFLGATPVIRQTATSQTPAAFVANTSGIVNDSGTWGGYTVGDIIAILQAFGFLT